MAATTSTNSCTSSSFFGQLSTGSVEPCRVRSTPNHPGCGKMDGLAMWVINGVAAAFFASLERCSCIRIATTEDDDCDDANDLPLIFNDGNFRGGDDGGSSRRRKGKGKKGGSGED